MLPTGDKAIRAGEAGEKRIQEILMLYKASNHLNGKLFKNVYLGHGEHTKETDFVFITSKGVFVVEVKNWIGQIEGTLIDDEWVQIKTYETIRPKNPIKQNRKHAEKLKSVIDNDMKKFPYYPITVFVKNNAPEIRSDELTNLSKLTSFLDRFGKDNHISNKDIEMACKLLETYIKMCGVTKEQHLRNVHKFE